MFIRFDPDAWRPHEGDREIARDLVAGQIVVWDRKPYRLVETREREHHDWPEKYREAWVDAGMPEPATWYHRPVMVVLRDVDDERAKPLHLCGPASHFWEVLPEHYSICRLCGELPPCTHVHTERVMERANERMEQEMAILPGCCHACREPITKRQKSITFAGPNLIRPDLGDDSAIFHLRRGCYGGARAYDERWAKATGSKRRLYCPGHQYIHADDSVGCTELAECVGRDVEHAARVWHRPGYGHGCWCVSGDAPERAADAQKSETPGQSESLF